MGQAPDNLVVIGRLGAVYGVKGWLKVHSFTDPADNLLDYNPLWLRFPGVDRAWRAVRVISGRPHGNTLVVQLEGVVDREQARRLTGCEVAVPATEMPELEAGDYYWHQLQGLRVLTRDNQLLGRVHSLMETGANDVLVVKPCQDSIDRRERLLPYLPDQVVLAVDLEAGEMRVDWDSDF